MTGSARRDDSGFLLVEAIVAFLILSLALAVGVQSISQGTAALRRADGAATAALVAREIFATRATALAEPGVWTGQHPTGAAWRLTAAPLDLGGVPLYRVTVEIRPEGSRSVYDYPGFAAPVPPS